MGGGGPQSHDSLSSGARRPPALIASSLRMLDKQPQNTNLTHEQRNPSSIFQDLTGNDAGGISTGAGTDAQKRRKSGRALVSHSRLVAWARENGREIDPASFLNIEEANFGGEHGVFLDPLTGRVVKLTKPGLYGYHAEDAGEYLQRWALSNRVFHDDSSFEGVVLLPGETEPRMVFSQPFIKGRDSTPEEISDYLRGKGFVEHQGNWVHPILGVTVRDTLTEGNAITKGDGQVVPIDWIVEPTEKADLTEVRRRSGQGRESAF